MRRSRGTCFVLLALCAPGTLTAGCGSGENGSRSSAGAELTPAERAAQASLIRSRKQIDAAQARHLAARLGPKSPHREDEAATTGSVQEPPIVQMPIPFPATRRAEMAAYAKRHYGRASFELVNPRVIVEHYTVTDTARGAYGIFARDVPDNELHELPGTCAHFVIDRDGTIYQLVSLKIMCRHVVGLNYTAIGIESTGFSDREILDNKAELASSLALTNWLRCRYRISISNVIGHNESLASPFHHENVARLRTQTHQDWTEADMKRYRALLPTDC